MNVKKVMVRVPSNRSRRAIEDILTEVSPEQLATMDKNGDVFQAVKETFIDELLAIYAEAGLPITREDLDITALE